MNGLPRARGVFLPIVFDGNGDVNIHYLVSNYNCDMCLFRYPIRKRYSILYSGKYGMMHGRDSVQ